MKISFDFDGCLADSIPIQKLAKTLQINNTICILTSRDPTIERLKQEVLTFAKEFGIDESLCYFTGEIYSNYKYLFINTYNIDIHFDDDEDEIKRINQKFPGVGVLINFERELYYE